VAFGICWVLEWVGALIIFSYVLFWCANSPLLAKVILQVVVLAVCGSNFLELINIPQFNKSRIHTNKPSFATLVIRGNICHPFLSCIILCWKLNKDVQTHCFFVFFFFAFLSIYSLILNVILSIFVHLLIIIIIVFCLRLLCSRLRCLLLFKLLLVSCREVFTNVCLFWGVF
jgi:hypothetical protein